MLTFMDNCYLLDDDQWCTLRKTRGPAIRPPCIDSGNLKPELLGLGWLVFLIYSFNVLFMFVLI